MISATSSGRTPATSESRPGVGQTVEGDPGSAGDDDDTSATDSSRSPHRHRRPRHGRNRPRLARRQAVTRILSHTFMCRRTGSVPHECRPGHRGHISRSRGAAPGRPRSRGSSARWDVIAPGFMLDRNRADSSSPAPVLRRPTLVSLLLIVAMCFGVSGVGSSADRGSRWSRFDTASREGPPDRRPPLDVPGARSFVKRSRPPAAMDDVGITFGSTGGMVWLPAGLAPFDRRPRRRKVMDWT